MKRVLIIGIGAGDPEQVTVQAIRALNEADVFFVIDKGADKQDLMALRQEICERYVENESYRMVHIPDPARDRTAASYRPAVEQWRRERAEIYERLIPGISSVQALAARHRVSLTQVGKPVHITTGRRLAEGLPEHCDDVVVMLDAACSFAGVAEDGLDIYWGAYLGTKDEILVSGKLADVADQIRAARGEARARRGWIMDTYLLRRENGQ